MAFQAYNKFFDILPAAGLNWPADDCRAVLVDTGGYTVDLVNHGFLSSVPAAARVATAPLTGKVITARALDAADTIFTAVTGVSVEAILIYKFVTADTDSPLLLWEPSATNMPITPSGNDITITWPAGPDYIYRLRNA